MDGRRRTAAEEVYLALKRDILTLRVPPGSALREADLAGRFGTSRVPVREACRRLQQDGLVESIPYKGYLAGRISIKELTDTFELRLLLETHALMESSKRAAMSAPARLSELSTHEYSFDDPDSWEGFLARNTEYHLALAALSGNDRLVRILRDLLEGLQRYFFLGMAQGDHAAEMREEHERLTSLVSEGRTAAALDCLRSQIVKSRERILHALVRARADIPLT